MTKYSCTILRSYEYPYNVTQSLRTVKVDVLRPTLNYVKKLNRRYLKRKIRYTIKVEKQI